jgi:hypothetical protein
MRTRVRSGSTRPTTSGRRLADAIRLLQIDESNIGDHSRLGPDDRCYFLFEYTSGKTWAFSRTNSLISNLKKKPSICSPNELYYKNQAIQQAAAALRQVLNPGAIKSVTLVPVPGSKAPDHADFDPRMERVCQLIAPGIDVRNIIVQTASTAAAHEAEGDRISVEDLLEVYEIDESRCQPVPSTIWIIDDVLTAGTHFRAMQTLLSQRFPNAPIYGVFIARRIFDSSVEL